MSHPDQPTDRPTNSGVTPDTGASRWQLEFLQQHSLTPAYLTSAAKWFTPLVTAIQDLHAKRKMPLLVGLNGSQGSGKTTASDYLCQALQHQWGLSALSISLDDFYYTKAERQQLARDCHPLFSTRGVPGTHDIDLLQKTLDQLLVRNNQGVKIPRFDKAVDDRVSDAEWTTTRTMIDVVILEGWCMGAEAVPSEELKQPINELERQEDAEASWREHVNQALADQYASVYDRVDCWVMLQAPSFDCVFGWRKEQEEKLRAARNNIGSDLMDDVQLRRFINHYERVTRWCLTSLPEKVHFLYKLNPEREVESLTHPREVIA